MALIEVEVMWIGERACEMRILGIFLVYLRCVIDSIASLMDDA